MWKKARLRYYVFLAFPYQYSITDLIEYTKAIIQDHLTTEQMTELKVHASNNANSTVLEFYSSISAENVLKKISSVKLIFKDTAKDRET